MPFAIVTDKQDRYVKGFDDIIVCKPARSGYMNKLEIDRYAPYDISIYIDCDCLVLKNIESYFDLFAENGSPFSVFGRNVDIPTTLKNPDEYYFKYENNKNSNIQYVPSFNGGVYYIEKCEKTSKVLEEARYMADDTHHDYGFIFVGDEAPISLAMAKNSCRCLEYEQIAVYHRVTECDIDIRKQKYRVVQWDRPVTDIGIFHFGTARTTDWLYKYLVSDMKIYRVNLWYKLWYATGYKKKMLQLSSRIKADIIQVLVKVKHSLLK